MDDDPDPVSNGRWRRRAISMEFSQGEGGQRLSGW